MTSLLTDTVRELGRAAGAGPSATGVPIVVLALLVLLLTEREMARFALAGRRAARAGSLGFVFVPLGLLFLVAVTVRVADLLS